MQALVLLNLVFVQLTGAAGLHWLIPLYAFTLGVPFLERFREKLVYRLLWNVVVVCFFLVLVRHALHADLIYVLEDGLVMAVLCQVHLLNNLRSNQRPDLLFFNAFLIAIITGFMNRGLGFPLVLLAFAPCFVIGLELLSATRGGRVLSPSVTRRLMVDGARRAGVILSLSLLAFLFWPRDFERKAFFRGTFDLSPGDAPALEVGFSEELALDRSRGVDDSDRPALRVTLLEGTSADVSPLWRGATLGATSGGGWHALNSWTRREVERADVPWEDGRGSPLRIERAGSSGPDGARVEVVRLEQATERLFAPLGTRALELAPSHAGLRPRPRSDGTVDVGEIGEVRYEATLVPLARGAPGAAVEPGGSWEVGLPAELGPYVDLPEAMSVRRARDLAASLAQRLPVDAEQHEAVTQLSDHLSRTYVYVAPGAEGAAQTLDEFLLGEAGGHCEFFASALATMLRSLEIPCRVVTGFRSSRWDPEGRVLVFGTSNAHAWVEVHDPQAGWYPVDPSPRLAEETRGPGLLTRLQAAARTFWETVTDFDSERRATVFAWVRGLPRRTGAALRNRPLDGLLAVLLLLLPSAWLIHRRRGRTPPAVRAYRSAVRRAKLSVMPGETPRELLRRARKRSLPDEHVQTLEAATRIHEKARYAT